MLDDVCRQRRSAPQGKVGDGMSRPKIEIVGAVRLTDEDGLWFSISLGKPPKTFWLKALDVSEWPGVGKYPESPKIESFQHIAGPERLGVFNAAKEQCKRDREAWTRSVYSDPKYKQAEREFLDRQMREPQSLVEGDFYWAYRGNVVNVDPKEPQDARNKDREALLIKHHVLQKDRHYEKVRREVQALENMEKLEGVSREPIPGSVRLFVWQRDRGQCVKCGSRERLEFDHIIPIATGGSNTERNVQLLCEACNRSKGATI
jgi:hypothetical protein